ncbi:MAG: PH domain-containing protein [Clostridia bacterium]|nr:PH domain-containing protein [Clostridia bacterium]
MKFRIRYSALIYVLASVSALLCVVGAVVNVINATGRTNGILLVSDVLIALLCVAVFVGVVLFLFLSRYSVKDGRLITRNGVFVSSVATAEITLIKLFKKENKLVVFYGDGKPSVIMISPDEYGAFTEELRKDNPHIPYDVYDDRYV